MTLPALDFAWAVAWPATWLGMTAKNAIKRPEELTEGKMLSVPASAPLASKETSCVEGVHDCEAAPKQVSRKYTWRPGPGAVPATRFAAAELNAT